MTSREIQPIEFEFGIDTAKPCRGKLQWKEEGRVGQYFGKIVINQRYWAIVLWDDEEDPTFCKAEAIEVKDFVWCSVD
jgi:hypothetical protein